MSEINKEADTGPGGGANSSGVAAVDRAFSIVLALEQTKSPMTLTEIAGNTGLYKSAVLRLMASLERSTLVVRRSDQRYTLGPLAFRLGKAFELSSHIEENLLPLMRELVDQGTESPSFHVRQDKETRLCLLRLDSKHSTLDRVRVGDVLPLHRGAAGKVLTRSNDRAGPMAAHAVLETSFGERDPSCAAIAGPVFGPGSEIMGSLSLSGPLERFTPDLVDRMRQPLLDACIKATNQLSGRWPW